MIEELVKKNEELLKKYMANPEMYQKHLIIAKFLKDKNCFFNISIVDAYNILLDLGFKNYEEIYMELISYKNYN